jgi:hypothetical protein
MQTQSKRARILKSAWVLPCGISMICLARCRAYLLDKGMRICGGVISQRSLRITRWRRCLEDDRERTIITKVLNGTVQIVYIIVVPEASYFKRVF